VVLLAAGQANVTMDIFYSRSRHIPMFFRFVGDSLPEFCTHKTK
jgi:hypothetical protein